MVLVGLTGGLGSGKSTVTRMLAARGAKVIDADAISREITEKGQSGYEALVVELGPEILREDDELDRDALARLVFQDPEKRALLNALLHPLIMQCMAERLKEYEAAVEDDGIVLLDVPLLVETGLAKLFRFVIVVLAEADQQVARVKEERQMIEQEARARIQAQASNEERLSVADFVIDNRGTLDELEKRVEEVWRAIREETRKRS